MSASAARSNSWFHRLSAMGGIALLLLLTASAASPALHHWLHDAAVDHETDACAVVLFASGVTLAAAALAVAAPRLAWTAPRAVVAEEIFLLAPRYLRQPERGPPGC